MTSSKYKTNQINKMIYNGFLDDSMMDEGLETLYDDNT